MKNERFEEAFTKIHVGMQVGWLTVIDKDSLVNRRHFVTLQCRCGNQKKLQPSQVISGKFVTCGDRKCTDAYRKENPIKGKDPSIIGEYAEGSLAGLSNIVRGVK